MKRPPELSVVSLKRDLPEFGLRSGHIGTVVLVYEPNAVEVEFIDRDGETHALLTLLDDDVVLATTEDIARAGAPDPWPAGIEAPIADATSKART